MDKSLLTISRFLGLCGLLSFAFPFALRSAHAQAADTQGKTPLRAKSEAKTPEEYLNDLKSSNVWQRRRAYEGLANADEQLHHSVLRTLEELKKNPDRSFGGSFEMTLRVVSAMNIREAVNDVGDMLDFQLDPATMPRGGFGAAISYYPVAKTAIDLKDGEKTIDLVASRFDFDASDTTIRVYTYVLQEVLGKKIAKFVIQNNVDNMNQKLGLMPNSIVIQTAKANYETALKLLESNEGILKMPLEETRTNKTNVNPVGQKVSLIGRKSSSDLHE